MNPECNYSFADLYTAAYGRPPEPKELKDLYALTQESRNKIVEQWAIQAGWGTEKRIGSDNVEYIAFCPLWK